VKRAFNRVADFFDTVLVRNPINSWMHEVNLGVLASTFPAGSCLLEIGCGTGTAAIDLAHRGFRVFGFDVSSSMVTKALQKVAAEGMQGRIRIVEGRGRDVLRVASQSPWGTFDGAYSNFALTYEEDLRGFGHALSKLIRPGAFFVCTLPNRVVLSEAAIYCPQGRFERVLRRLETPLKIEVEGSLLEIRAYSPWQVRELFRDSFDLTAVVGVPTFLPPVYLHAQYAKLGGGQRLLKGLDSRFAMRYPWNRFGEHTLFKFRRK